jgi:hypothetical protein
MNPEIRTIRVSPGRRQRHVHELCGSTEIAGSGPHNHRFAAVTCEAKPGSGNNHIHEVWFRTDFYRGHYHEFSGKTGGADRIGDRHVHFITGATTENEGHRHEFRTATLIEDPIAEK